MTAFLITLGFFMAVAVAGITWGAICLHRDEDRYDDKDIYD